MPPLAIPDYRHRLRQGGEVVQHRFDLATSPHQRPLSPRSPLVKRVYADLQAKLLKNHAVSKTQALAYDVARFVWGQELAHGERPPWAKLREWWNERHPEEKQVKDYRPF